MENAFANFSLPTVEEKKEKYGIVVVSEQEGPTLSVDVVLSNVPHRKTNDRFEICELTAKLIQRPTKQVLGMTRKWSVQKLRERYLQCEKCADPSHEWFKLRFYDKENATAEPRTS